MHYGSYPALAYPNVQHHSTKTAVSDPNPFPPVDIKLLNASAKKFQSLMKEADKLVNKIGNSKAFAYELMNEAQQSNTKKVEKLILSTGILLKVETSYTPTGIRIKFNNADIPGRCCQLVMVLHW